MFAGQQFLNCVRSEIHNVLSTMRRNGRWASEERFQREIPLQFETPLVRAFKTLHDYLLGFDDINDVDAVAYLKPFLDVVSFRNTNGAMTGRALSSINKFLLYGSISLESPHAREAVNLAVASVVDCKFESTNAYNDEVVLMQLLEVIVNLLRCPAGPYITDVNLWKMVETCFRLNTETGTSVLLRSTAANSLTHVILTMFSRSADLITSESIIALLHSEALNFEGPAESALEKIVDLYDGESLRTPDSEADNTESDITFDRVLEAGEDDIFYRTLGRSSSNVSAIRLTQASNLPPGYGLPILVKTLGFLSDLTDPASHAPSVRIFALQLINIVLETAGETLGITSPGSKTQTPLVAVLQGDLCKFLLQNSQSEDLAVQSLTLRVVFNLFNAMKGHLKVQLEVFLISVHLRIAESKSASCERKELALESLLDFCREPALMLDLYTNYDCDFRCTNLFETLCKCLCRCAVPTPTGNQLKLTSLHRLSLEGILAVIEDIAHRCSSKPIPEAAYKDTTDASSEFSAVSADMLDVSTKQVTEEKLGWLETARERTAIVLRSRKQKKRRLLLAAKQFNKSPNKSYWIDYAKDLGVLPSDLTPDDVALFFLNTPGLDKTKVGDYLGDGPKEEKPFNARVLEAYIKQFDFKNIRIDEALRLVLESFRLPGEAQKVDRIMEAFGSHLYEQNLTYADFSLVDKDAVGVFASPDAAFIFAFSIILLHTDLHNEQIRPDKKMQLEDFVRNNRGINEGENLPRSLLERVYESIKENQIRMLYDPHAHSEVLDIDNKGDSQGSAGPTWDGVLRHSATVDEASFTPASLSRRWQFRAGVHERDMFTIIFDSAMTALSSTFELTADGKMVTRALEGYRNLAKIAAYFEMVDALNSIVITLCKYFCSFASALTDSVPSDSDIEALRSLKEAVGLSFKEQVSQESMAATILRAEMFASNPSCKALLTFQALLSLAMLYGSHMREAWRNIVRSILLLHEARLLPHAFVELDDVPDVKEQTSAAKQEPDGVQKKEQQGGVWNVLTSFLWAEPASQGRDSELMRFLMKETIAGFRLNYLFLRSKGLQLDSLSKLIAALSIPFDESERNLVLCVELLSEVALSNESRIEEVWPSIAQVYTQTLETAGVQKGQVRSVVIERVLVNQMRINVRLLESRPEFAEPLMLSLEWLLHVKDDLANKLSPRVGEGIGTILRFNSSSVQTEAGWRIACKVLEKYGRMESSKEVVWRTVQELVEKQQVQQYNFDALRELVLMFASEAYSPNSTGAAAAVDIYGEMSRLIFSHELCKDPGAAWLGSLLNIKGMFLDSRGEVNAAAGRQLQSMLWSPPAEFSGNVWVEIFQKILFPLIEVTKDKSEEVRLNTTTLLTRTLLQNIKQLAQQTDFNLLWLRVINILSVILREKSEGMYYVSTLETLKNLIMVLHAEEIFHCSSSAAEGTVWDLTWNTIDSHAPHVRKTIEEIVEQLNAGGSDVLKESGGESVVEGQQNT